LILYFWLFIFYPYFYLHHWQFSPDFSLFLHSKTKMVSSSQLQIVQSPIKWNYNFNIKYLIIFLYWIWIQNYSVIKFKGINKSNISVKLDIESTRKRYRLQVKKISQFLIFFFKYDKNNIFFIKKILEIKSWVLTRLAGQLKCFFQINL
jgi:hypothetical protein